MCNGIIAKKIGMSRVFTESGEAVPVTYLEVEPNTVVRTKSEEKDGYNAVVLGVKAKKWKSRKGKENTRYGDQKEWKVDSLEGLEAGKQLTCEKFAKESKINICGVSKGKGFQGVIKRHKFATGPKTHGSHHHRRPGSVGMCEYPGRVLKGKKMPGRMGRDQVTIRDREVLVCDPEKGVIAVKGPIPGPNGSNVYITLTSDSDSSES
jgi:large subunit ribosomal protein L3